MKKILSLAAAALLTATAVIPAQAEHIFEEALGEVAFGVQKATAAWAADGVKTPGEYYDIEYQPAWISTMTSGDTNETTAAIDVDLAMSWDETYFYTWISYTDPDGYNFTAAGQPDFWNGDIVQFSGADGDAAGDGMRLEVGFGKYSDSGELASVNWQDYLGSGFAASGSFPAEDCNIFVNGDVLTFEFRIPFEYFVTADAMTEGSQCRVSVCFNWTSADGGYATWQLASGISGGKDAGNHALVTLEAAPVVYTYPASGTDGSLITGELIGNETGWGENADAGRAAGFDGNPATFFDPLGVGDGFLGIQASESYILDKAAILSRSDYPDRFEGAMIQGSNDGETWTTLWTSAGAAASVTEYTIVTEFENNTGYTMFRYFNETQHGDVAEVEFYGNPGKVEPVVEEVVEEPVAEVVEVAEEPAAEEVVEALAAAVVVEEAPQTFDMGIIAAISALVSLAGFAVSKKR